MAELVEARSFPFTPAMPFWAYMLHCADRTFYVGHTDELEKRIGQHDGGLVPSYTSGRLPVGLVWSQEFATRHEARQAELQLKGWGRAKKLALIRGDWTLISALARGRKEGASTSSAKPVSESKPVSVFLHPHPGHLPSESFSLEVGIRRNGDRLHLKYRLTGPLEIVRIPPPAPMRRKDGLWRHSCFEAFMKSGREAGYTELNLAPSTEWAAYRFRAYRDGMAIFPATCRIRTRSDRYALEVSATIDLPAHDGSLDFNLAAVIEEKSGTKSYWALAHPPGAPDFHHLDCFVLELPAPDGP